MERFRANLVAVYGDRVRPWGQTLNVQNGRVRIRETVLKNKFDTGKLVIKSDRSASGKAVAVKLHL